MRLVALVYANNTCYTNVKELSDVKGISVDMENRVWKYNECGVDKTYPFNSMRRCTWGSRFGPIAVIDVSTIDGLNHLIHFSREAVQEPSNSD